MNIASYNCPLVFVHFWNSNSFGVCTCVRTEGSEHGEYAIECEREWIILCMLVCVTVWGWAGFAYARVYRR